MNCGFLLVVWDATTRLGEFVLPPGDEILLGRHPETQLRIDHSALSPFHFNLRIQEQALQIRSVPGAPPLQPASAWKALIERCRRNPPDFAIRRIPLGSAQSFTCNGLTFDFIPPGTICPARWPRERRPRPLRRRFAWGVWFGLLVLAGALHIVTVWQAQPLQAPPLPIVALPFPSPPEPQGLPAPRPRITPPRKVIDPIHRAQNQFAAGNEDSAIHDLFRLYEAAPFSQTGRQAASLMHAFRALQLKRQRLRSAVNRQSAAWEVFIQEEEQVVGTIGKKTQESLLPLAAAEFQSALRTNHPIAAKGWLAVLRRADSHGERAQVLTAALTARGEASFLRGYALSGIDSQKASAFFTDAQSWLPENHPAQRNLPSSDNLKLLGFRHSHGDR